MKILRFIYLTNAKNSGIKELKTISLSLTTMQ